MNELLRGLPPRPPDLPGDLAAGTMLATAYWSAGSVRELLSGLPLRPAGLRDPCLCAW